MNRLTRSFFAFSFVVIAVAEFAPSLYSQTESPASVTLPGPTGLACSPAPCVLPNVQASSGTGFSVSANIAANPANALQLLIGAGDSSCTSGAAAYGTSDGGTTWSRGCLPPPSPSLPDGLPTLAYNRKNKAYAAVTVADDVGSDNAHVDFTQSADNGATWAALKTAAAHILGFAAYTGTLVVDNTPSSPFVNSLYISATQYGNSANVGISVSRSANGRATTTLAAKLPNSQSLTAQGYSQLASGADGTLYLSWMTTPSTNTLDMMFSKSSDGGITWTSPALIATAVPVPNYTIPNTSAQILADPPVLAVDNSNGTFAGRLYATFYNWTGTFMQVQVANSADGGTTWGAPVPVAPASDTRDQFFPCVSVSPSGLVGVTWMDRRNDPANVKYQAFAGFSQDGGATFLQNVAIAKVQSDSGKLPVISDVTNSANVWVGKTLYAVWPDTRTGTLQAEVGGVAQSR